MIPTIDPKDPELVSEDTAQSASARKRSKVSRACDECRRKKIKCDATFLANSNTLLKPCTNCYKYNCSCSFTRVPLKRGPSKGFARDGSGYERRRSSSVHSVSSSQSVTSPVPSHASLPIPPANPVSLPRLNVPGDGLLSPKAVPPTNLFWKVPYELPSFSDRRSSVASADSFRRPSIYQSDSEDDFYSATGSQRNSISQAPRQRNLSPALSVSSTSSLNNRIKSLNMVASTLESNIHNYYSQGFNSSLPILPLDERILSTLLSNVSNGSSSASWDAIRSPILELFDKSILMLLRSYESQFNFNDLLDHVTEMQSIYPRIRSHLLSDELLKLIFLMSGVLTDYALILTGQPYSTGLSITVSVFNDWKTYENVQRVLVINRAGSLDLDYDSLPFLFARCYLSLATLDLIYSLSFSSPRLISSFANLPILDIVQKCGITKDAKLDETPLPVLDQFLNCFLPGDTYPTALNTLKTGLVLLDFTNNRSTTLRFPFINIHDDNHMTGLSHLLSNVSDFMSQFTEVHSDSKDSQLLFLRCIWAFWEIGSVLSELIDHFISSSANSQVGDKDASFFYEHQLKVTTLLGTFSNIASAFLTSSTTAASHPPPSISPFHIISMVESFKMVQFLNKLIASFISLNEKLEKRELEDELSKCKEELNNLNERFQAVSSVQTLPVVHVLFRDLVFSSNRLDTQRDRASSVVSATTTTSTATTTATTKKSSFGNLLHSDEENILPTVIDWCKEQKHSAEMFLNKNDLNGWLY
ncbi:Glucose transport transcription factor [Komagataella phaffii CBS 7435]|uniref:Zn(2)-C6 fungal-type domain-containing protein n=2 Tax=Komagataella phaffii TaxID=460519 RepID=C4QVM2_KOMPG|nr:Hypothetical protein PAS_chr1-3_0233 [Komagataella phaffii GS115]AOA60338.1 GQ67_02494T0 [Komagataella phaffii]CAH2445952.1 Glucose transport transcription factor [Komagataella phaffii CBS 7435]AOA66014.1 GQ68_02753T0 [Komagataella phaffii GS115]CAY67295.1 Hypothetical protein PAS_chr1-3_0233 [Komagataella phaffii GS115]CCA36400.1 Glucose transport transcription factor [Komagataella phaffii CBS 7435]